MRNLDAEQDRGRGRRTEVPERLDGTVLQLAALERDAVHAVELSLHRAAELLVVLGVVLEPVLLLLGEGVVARVRAALEELARRKRRGDPGLASDKIVDALGVRLQGGDDLNRGGALCAVKEEEGEWVSDTTFSAVDARRFGRSTLADLAAGARMTV